MKMKANIALILLLFAAGKMTSTAAGQTASPAPAGPATSGAPHRAVLDKLSRAEKN